MKTPFSQASRSVVALMAACAALTGCGPESDELNAPSQELTTASGALGPNLLINPSFEEGPACGCGSTSYFETLYAGDGRLTGWTVLPHSIDHVGTQWSHANGIASVDINGPTTGGISQSVTTTPGVTYVVRFALAGNPDPNPDCAAVPIKRVRVTVGGTSRSYSFDITGKSYTNMGWSYKSFTFVAPSTSETLTFQSLTNTACGPVIDDVSLAQQ
jgi:choice-of-anchor C domain-containing protein